MSDTTAPARFRRVAFERLRGWQRDDHAAAFRAFRLSAAEILERPPKTRGLGLDGAALAAPAKAALALPAELPVREARAFFEAWFEPQRILPRAGGGFVTGYYEPEVDGALVRSDRFPVPLHRRPDDLVEIGPDDDRTGLDPALTWARRRPDGRLEEHPDRAAVMAGALDGRGLDLVFLKSWVEAFFIHVQGSARVRLAEGGTLRVAFAGKTGQPYFPVARVLVERGLMTPREATADVLRAWLQAHPDEAPAVLARNRSYIVFAEAPVADPALGPRAAARVPLTPGRSLAVDRTLMTFHMPIYVESQFDGESEGERLPFRRLMVAQDTGSAILGPARGDIFFGTGEEAFAKAARVRHAAKFTVLIPRSEPAGGP